MNLPTFSRRSDTEDTRGSPEVTEFPPTLFSALRDLCAPSGALGVTRCTAIRRSLLCRSVFCLLASGLSPLVSAAPTDDQIARLGVDLTPLGGEVAGNAGGTIPAWTGGLASPPAGYKVGDHHPDPFADETPRFTITAENLAEHEAALPAGLAALARTYPDTFKLPVYPSHRTAAAPPRIYDATRRIAATARLVNDGAGIEGAIVGIPFPLPTSGLEVVWNHLTRFRGEAAIRSISQAAPSRGGSYTLVDFEDEFLFNYQREGLTPEQLDNVLIYFKQAVLGPPRLAGQILLAHETVDQVREPRRAWVYNPGQRRVRRAPNVAYDAPGTAADGMRTTDQFDMFNGATDRYTWELVGKRELIVPYNSYRLHSDTVKVRQLLTPRHLNPEFTRYELHRVWVVEAKLKPGTSHLYSRRTFYIDEDSWQALVVDQYDGRGQLWRVSEAHCISYYEVPTFWSTLEVHTDLLDGRYLAVGLDNERPMYDFTVKRSPGDFSPDTLRREGLR